MSNFAGPVLKTDDRPTVIAFVERAQEQSTNENAHSIGKPAVEDEFTEIDHIEFPLTEQDQLVACGGGAR